MLRLVGKGPKGAPRGTLKEEVREELGGNGGSRTKYLGLYLRTKKKMGKGGGQWS